jgi:hypothetical protein
LSSQIIAKVVAINSYGNSTESEEGSGAIIITAPDAPINLTEDITLRTESTVTLTWMEAPIDGGAAVLDYQVSSI